MFVLILTYKAPIEKVLELLDAHRCYLDKYYATGNFLASGPQVPREGWDNTLSGRKPGRGREYDKRRPFQRSR